MHVWHGWVQSWERDTAEIKSLAEMHAWLHATHLCYSVSRQVTTALNHLCKLLAMRELVGPADFSMQGMSGKLCNLAASIMCAEIPSHRDSVMKILSRELSMSMR